MYIIIGITTWLAYNGADGVVAQRADLEYFYKAGAWMLDHGNMDARVDILEDGTIQPRGGIEWYIPFVPRFVSVFVYIGRLAEHVGLPAYQVTGLIWLAINIAALLTILRLLGQYMMGLPPTDWPVTLFVPFIAIQFFCRWEFWLNQINVITLLLLVASFVHWRQGRKSVAGFWLGLAVLLKLTPMVLVGWFVLKRQFRVVAVAVLTIVLAGPVGDVIAFGPSYTKLAYENWAEIALVKGSQTGLVLNQKEMDWRNQGIGSVAARWLAPTDYSIHFDNDPRIKYESNPAFLNIVSLSRETVAKIVMAIVAASVLFLVWIARKPAARCTIWELRLEWALYVLAMLWLMPVMRRYHLIWVLPMIAILAACMHYHGHDKRWSLFALGSILVVVAAQLAIISRWVMGTFIVEAVGTFLFVLPILAAPAIVMILRLQRDPHALPPDAYEGDGAPGASLE